MQRNTQQRAAIVRTISEAGRPLSPLEIHRGAKRFVPDLGIATVYRAIKDLIAENQLVAVDVPGGPPRYEPAGMSHHHHFLCRSCNRLLDLRGCPGDLETLAPPGCSVESHELTLIGQCSDCGIKRRKRRATRARRNT